jgi:23S rRNA-/tRNA-specific pseudouridylate synthase
MEKPKILIQSEKWAVIFKPAGMATQLSDDAKGSSLEAVLKSTLEKEHIFFPHRLDRITQGILLIAFDKETVAYFNNEIKNKRFDKYYLAKVEADLPDPLNLIGIHKRFIKVEDKISRIVKSGGLPSFLEILAIESAPESPECYHVLVKLLTGRMHQIRVMLADMGIPLCGDFLYNSEYNNKDFYLESIVLNFKDTAGIEQSFYFSENPDREKIGVGIYNMLYSVIQPL